MARWSGRKIAIWVASAGVLVGCIGGQTSDPGGGTCETRVAPANTPVGGVSPAEFARAFAGSYSSTLRWTAVARANAAAPIPDDEISITLTYQGADGVTGCGLYVPVTIEIMTRDSGIDEIGEGNLSMANTTVGGLALLNFTNARVTVFASFDRSTATVQISGSLELLGNSPSGQFPSGSKGVFPPPAANTGGAGTGGAP